MGLDSVIKNHQPQNLYGKVIDQNGQPVAGVNVEGDIELMNGWIVGKIEKHHTQTDANGLFQFTRLKGTTLSANVSKPGYEIDYRVGRIAPVRGQSSQNDRVTFVMCKILGGEPMVHDKKFYGINPDGRIFTIDLVNKKKTEGTNAVGDLQVQIQRPVPIKRGGKFDWSFAVTAVGGGIIEVTNATYLNEAPESGYQPSCNVNMSAANQSWQEQIEKTFYFKSRDGKVFGRFHAAIIPNYNDTSVFDIESYINPAGSRNLEFDPSKQIMR